MIFVFYFGFIVLAVCEQCTVSTSSTTASQSVSTTPGSTNVEERTRGQPVSTTPGSTDYVEERTRGQPVSTTPGSTDSVEERTRGQPVSTTPGSTDSMEERTRGQPVSTTPGSTNYVTERTTTVHEVTTTRHSDSNILDLIRKEEEKIDELTKDKSELYSKIEKSEGDCQKEVEKYEKLFQEKKTNYSSELKIQNDAIKYYSKLFDEFRNLSKVKESLMYNVKKQQFINVLLVEDLNVLIKRREAGFYKTCVNYTEDETLQIRTMMDLLNLYSVKPENKLIRRLNRLQNISKDLEDDKSYLLSQLHFLVETCENEVAVVKQSSEALIKSLRQLQLNTIRIKEKSKSLTKNIGLLKKFIANKTKYLNKLAKTNIDLQIYAKRFKNDEACYSKLKQSLIEV